MNRADFTERATGRLVPTIQNALAFVPDDLPPRQLDLGKLLPAVARAERAVGELNGIGGRLPNPYLLVRPFMRREAVASSRIEGTVTTLSELFLFEVEGAADRRKTRSDAREVWNYVRALEHCLKRLDTLPISLRLIREAHEFLMQGVALDRGAAIVPGEFKRDQNWIGARLIQNARFVPPPPAEAERAMDALEKYVNAPHDELPLIIRLALIHYQFEAIHPFPDGNGRVGRLLIPLILCEREEMSQPLLYLSPYFEKNFDAYIDRMFAVSTQGAWNDWIEFFLNGVAESSHDAIAKASALQDLQARYHNRVRRARTSALLGQLIDILFESPAVTVPHVAARLKIAYNAAKKHVDKLVAEGVIKPAPAGTRPRHFLANEIIDVLSS
jgi:Fic family protein